MGNTGSLEEYENRIQSLENRVLELEQKVFLQLDDTVIRNIPIFPNKEMFKCVNPHNNEKIILNDFIEKTDNKSS